MTTSDRIMTTCDCLAALLVAKNKNYGDSAFESPILCPNLSAEDALWTRLSDKVKRLRNLREGNSDLVGESIDDTLRDLAGYAILIMTMRTTEEMMEANDRLVHGVKDNSLN